VFQRILTALAISAVACSSLAATPAKPHKRRHPVAAASSTRKHTVAASTKATKASSRLKGKIARKPLRSYQQAPTPDRYREIQQALVSKGYYKGEPSGEWSADSSDALKRFQADQNLMPDGKINSLSLIALGLGPKRLTAKSDAAPPSQIAPPVSPSVAPVK
jgi:hypothetical protein